MQNDNQNSADVYNNRPIVTPMQLKSFFPLIEKDSHFIETSQSIIKNIIYKKDPRLLIICGPCSIHDVHAAWDYANKLKSLSIELQDQLYIVMRVYLEKPRTIIGWKGLINDPDINASYNIETGLKLARGLLSKLVKIGLPLATEILNPYIPQYMGDLFSWVAIGARTTESQIHREVASGLRSVVGFKNSTDGNICNAINAMCAAALPHHYISINQLGQICILSTKGNSNSHIILRGGIQPNYHPENIVCCEQKIIKTGLSAALMIDCSHGNSQKDYRRQVDVVQSVVKQIKDGNRSIVGLMLESYLCSGNQNVDLKYPYNMRYGVSITDACIDWETTRELLYYLYSELKLYLAGRLSGD